MRSIFAFLIAASSVVVLQGNAHAVPQCLDDSDCTSLDTGGGVCGGVQGYCLYPMSYNCATRTVSTAPAGTACTDDGNACTADSCDGSGTCKHTPIPGCTPPPECTTDANCADLDSTTACAKTVGVCTAGKCVASTTSTPCTTTGGGGGGGGCSIVGPRGASAGFVWMLAMIAASCLYVRRRRA